MTETQPRSAASIPTIVRPALSTRCASSTRACRSATR